jgi:hypothetical protein
VKRIRARLTAEMKSLRGHNAQMVLIRGGGQLELVRRLGIGIGGDYPISTCRLVVQESWGGTSCGGCSSTSATSGAGSAERC